MVNERKNPYRLGLPLIWEDIAEIKSRLEKLESKSDTYDVLFEIRTMEEMDSLVKTIREELQKYGIVRASVEQHD